MKQRKMSAMAGFVMAMLLCAAYVLTQNAQAMRFDPAKLEADYGLKIETKEKAVTVKVGDTLNAIVTDLSKVAAAGLNGTQKGNKLKMLWQGGNSWQVGPRDNKLKTLNKLVIAIGTLE
jgi:hypothetical protein